jgi:hypothetical protein
MEGEKRAARQHGDKGVFYAGEWLDIVCFVVFFVLVLTTSRSTVGRATAALVPLSAVCARAVGRV